MSSARTPRLLLPPWQRRGRSAADTRFRKEETKNEPAFSEELASLADAYVDDAFGSCHRAHCSTAGVTDYVKDTAVGYLMEKEIKYLGNAVNDPERPFTAILGGAKLRTS